MPRYSVAKPRDTNNMERARHVSSRRSGRRKKRNKSSEKKRCRVCWQKNSRRFFLFKSQGGRRKRETESEKREGAGASKIFANFGCAGERGWRRIVGSEEEDGEGETERDTEGKRQKETFSQKEKQRARGRDRDRERERDEEPKGDESWRRYGGRRGWRRDALAPPTPRRSTDADCMYPRTHPRVHPLVPSSTSLVSSRPPSTLSNPRRYSRSARNTHIYMQRNESSRDSISLVRTPNHLLSCLSLSS